MRCGRADRVELDAFLLSAAGDETVDAFREHYPHCADCSAVVADWMTLDGALREIMAETGEHASAHPEPEDLAGYAEAPLRYGKRLGEKAMQIQNHVAGCASCANELKLIAGFDPAMFGPRSEAMPAVARDRKSAEAGLFDSLRGALAGFVESLRGFDLMSPAPALAMVLIVLAGLWWSGALDGFGAGRPESNHPQLVERTAPETNAPSPAPEPDAGASELAATPEPKAQTEVTPDRAAEQAPVELAQSAEQPDAEAMPTRKPPVTSPIPKAGPKAGPEAGSAPAATQKPEEVLLAAVSELPPPSYATPAGAESLVWMRQFGAVRAAPNALRVLARAPDNHTGLTLSRTPRLWWALDQPTDLPIQITIVDGDAIDPLVRVELPGPHAAGLHAFDLAKQGAELSPDVEYRWFVSIVVDPDRPSRNPVSAGSLRVAAASDGRRQSVGAADVSARGNKFAELGLWYDAFDFYASLAEAHPEVERLATYRDRLVEVARPKP